MIDREKIPAPLLEELLNLYGEENTEQIVDKVGYNYQRLTWMVTNARFKKKYGFKVFPLFLFFMLLIIAAGIFFLRF
jgi:hypothetical protein